MQITEAESEIMKALWRHGPMSSEAIIAGVLETQPWAPATVKTLITRLLKKGAIESRRANAKLTYHPLVEEADYVEAESQHLLDRLFDGQLTPLVSHFVERRKLSKRDVKRLRALIDKLEND